MIKPFLVFLLLLSTYNVEAQDPQYKTLDDSVFVEGDLILLSGLSFQLSGGGWVTPETLNILDPVIDFMKTHKDLDVEIVCHIRKMGTDEFTTAVSELRATGIVEYIVSKGIAAERLSSKGYGESQLLIRDAGKSTAELNKQKEELSTVDGITELRILNTD